MLALCSDKKSGHIKNPKLTRRQALPTGRRRRIDGRSYTPPRSLPEMKERERFKVLVIVGTRSYAHTLRSQVGIRSGSHCLLRQFNRNLWILDPEAEVKEKKLECAAMSSVMAALPIGGALC